MLKKIFLPMLASIMMMPNPVSASPQTALSESLSTAFGTGTVTGEVGLSFRVNEAKDNSSDGTIGMAYLELGYLTNEFKGAQFGAHFIGIGELWSRKSYEHAFNDSGEFQDKAMLRDVYVNYSIPNSESHLQIGRAQFEGTPVTDGDTHQGIQLVIGDIEKMTVYASVMNRWVDNASTSYDLDGIDATWLDGDDIVPGASDTVFSLIAEFAWDPETLVVAPFLIHQSDVVKTYGSWVDFSLPVRENLTAGFHGAFAQYDEDTASPDDEDAYSYNLYGSLGSENWRLGLGYYVMSDDERVGLTALGNDTFDPMEEGVYGAARDDNTIYVDAEYTHGPVTVAAVFGDTEVDRTAEGATELDFYLTYTISEALTAEFMFVDVNDDDSSLDYQVYAGTFKLAF